MKLSKTRQLIKKTNEQKKKKKKQLLSAATLNVTLNTDLVFILIEVQLPVSVSFILILCESDLLLRGFKSIHFCPPASS